MGIVSSTVTGAFTKADGYAQAASAQATAFVDKLNTSIYTPPQIDVTWASLAAPSLPGMPAAPTLPVINFNDPSTLRPTDFTPSTPTVTIDAFTDVAPTVNFGTAPTVSYGTAPTVPAINTVTVPTAPTLTTPTMPTMLGLTTVAFGGVDLHAEMLPGLTSVPTLTLAEPTPYSYAPGPKYASTLLSTLQAKLAERLTGGTGLSPAVEQAIWERARTRETGAAQANIDEINRGADALGFHLPAGVITAQTREAQQEYYDKLSELSRDVAIKQADLEQANLKDTIAAGMQLEGTLMDYSYKLEHLTFESAKELASNAILAYNAAVEQYRALLHSYEVYANNYKTIIEGEMSKVEVYKAELQGEEIKAQVNQTLTMQYKAQIEAGMAQVEIYRAQVGAAQTLVALEQAKISAAGEQIRGYIAQVNAETAKVEAYKASVQGEASKVEAYSAQVRAYAAKVGAQAEAARVQLGVISAQTQVYAAKWEGYRAAVSAETARMTALSAQSSALLDGYRAASTATIASAEMNAKVWEASIHQYEASKQLALQTAKINSENLIMTNNARLDAAKVGAQVFAQLTSSAYGMIHASANLQGGQSLSASYNYSGDATGTVLIDP